MPPVVDVTDPGVLNTLVASSAELPVVLLMHLEGDAACTAAMQRVGAAAAAPGAGFRVGLVEVNELPEVSCQRRTSL